MTTLASSPSTAQGAVPPLARLADAVAQVPLVDGSTARFVNLDYAASAPPLAAVHRAVTRTLSYYASIHRGQSYLSRVSTAAYERARETVARLTGARADDVVVFTRNTTDAMNLLAHALPSGTTELKPGQRVEFGIVAGRRGDQALQVRILDPLPSVSASVAAASRKKPDELVPIIEDLIKLLDDVSNSLRRGRHPDRADSRKVASVLRAVATDLES